MLIEGLIGTATGLLSNFVTSWQNNKQQKLNNEHELKMAEFGLKRIEAEKQMMIAEAEANIKITQTIKEGEIQAIESKGEMDAFLETIKLGNEKALSADSINRLYESKWTKPFGVLLTLMLGFVDWVRHFIRPALTIYMVLLATFMTIQVIGILDAAQRKPSIEEALNMFSDVKDIVFYLTVTLITWWFGDRRMAKNMAKKEKN